MIRLSDEILKRLDPMEGGAIADVGCGFGGTLKQISQSIGPITLHALNIDKRQLQMARDNIQPILKSSQTCEFTLGDACNLPYEDESLDRILAFESAFHFSSRKQFLEHSYRTLKPGGKLVLSDFAINLKRIHFFWPQLFYGKYLRQVYGNNPLPWTSQQYKILGRKLGFSQVICEDFTANTFPTREIMKHFADKVEFTEAFDKANRLMEYFVKKGAIQYIVVTMIK